MPYKFFEDIAIADVAFEATGATEEELFESAALAVTNTMIKDLKKISKKVKKEIKVEGENLEMLLFNFLQEIIFLKDAEQLLLNKFEFSIEINKNTKKYMLFAKAYGEKLNMKKHELLVDVKAVTMHHFEVMHTHAGWKATVILDV